jgi:Holliday junction resolvasome RuvABC DNA-binding subunit
LTLTYEQLAAALDDARHERTRAEAERARAQAAAREIAALAEAERAAKRNAERLLVEERARVKQLEDERRRLSTQLK